MPHPTPHPCPRCPRISNPISGTGPAPAPIFLMGDYPGYWDIRKRQHFSGDVGRELAELYLTRIAKIDPATTYLTNALKCATPDPDPKSATFFPQVNHCTQIHLERELLAVNPEIVVSMGPVACSQIWGITNLELQHGIPTRAQYGKWQGWVFPTYHPSTGGSDGGMMIHATEDFHALGEFYRTRQEPPADKWAGNEDYRILESSGQLQEVLESGWCWQMDTGLDVVAIAEDTENTPDGRPFNLSISMQPGTGYIIMADRRDLLEELEIWQPPITPPGGFQWIFHYALHDIKITKRLGLWRTPGRPVPKYVDTMMQAYHRQNLHQGLKSLAYRLCGMQMRDFEDVVRPYSEPRLREWLMAVADPVGIGLDNPLYMKKSTKKEVRHKNPWGQELAPRQTSIDRKATRILNDEIAKGEGAIDIFNRWANVPELERDWITGVLGEPAPELSIAHVGREDFVRYAGRDPDATFRVWLKMRELVPVWERE